MEERKTIGERLLERIKTRSDKRVRAFEPTSYNDRYERYARTRGMCRLGLSMFPDHSTDGYDPERGSSQSEGHTYLSGVDFWARMRRLGNARLRRQQWLNRLSERYGHQAPVSMSRRLPEARPRSSLPFFGVAALALDDLTLIDPDNGREQEGEEELSAWGERVGRGDKQGARVSDSPWLSGTFIPARVSRSQKKEARPLERIIERAPAEKATVEYITRVVEAGRAGPMQRERVVRQVSSTASTANRMGSTGPGDTAEGQTEAERSVSRQVRRALRRRTGLLSPASSEIEAALPDDFLPASSHAVGRLRPRTGGGRRRGLRPVFASSPLMTAIEGSADHAVDNDAPQQSLSRRGFGAAGQGLSQRVAHRAAAPSGPTSDRELVSASPVRRPFSTTRRMQISSPDLAILEPNEVALAAPEADVQPSTAARKARSPLVRAVERGVEPALEPTRSSAPARVARRPTSKPVQTPSGVFAPERALLIPGVPTDDQTKAGSDAVEAVAAARRTNTRHVMERAAQMGAPSNESVLPQVAVRSAERMVQGLPGAEYRPARVVRTAAGGFTSEQVLLESDTDEVAASERISSRQRPGTRERSTDELAGAPYALRRLDTVGEIASTGRTMLPSVTPLSSPARVVLASSDSEPDDADTGAPIRRREGVAESSTARPIRPEAPGIRALRRSLRTPLVGYTAERSLSETTEKRTRSPWSPRRSASPVAHVRDSEYTPARTARASSFPDTITISVPSDELGLDGADLSAAPMSALRAKGIRAAQSAWEQEDRPLDWSTARIEVVQGSRAIAGTSTPMTGARIRTTAAGTYVPAQAIRGTARTMRGPAPVTTLPEQPEASGDTTTDLAPWRSSFEDTVDGIGAGTVHSDMPIWAQRSTGAPRIHGAEQLVSALAKASQPQEVVNVLMNRSDGVSASTLPQPVIQVIQQIQSEATKAESEMASADSVATTPIDSGRARGRRGVRSTTRVVRGFTGIQPRAAAGGRSSSLDKVTKLAKRLQELIAMAEGQQRGAARREVRMAEDSGAARSEAQAAPTSAEDGQDSSMDVDALTREVTEAVTRELEMRRERRQEDPDGRSIWW